MFHTAQKLAQLISGGQNLNSSISSPKTGSQPLCFRLYLHLRGEIEAILPGLTTSLTLLFLGKRTVYTLKNQGRVIPMYLNNF